jgi:hypothetical protein
MKGGRDAVLDHTDCSNACVLAVLSRGDEYGYRLTQEVKQVMAVSESTCTGLRPYKKMAG